MTNELDNIVEALIFASPEGASTKEITRCIRSAVASARETDGENAAENITRHAAVTEEDVVVAIANLNIRYLETERAFMLVERPAGWRIVTRMEHATWVRELFPEKKPARLSPSALETLAIIAYRQPVTRSSIEAVRGVGIDGPLQTLLDRNVVRIAGRADLPGRPLLYETTDLFLDHFGFRTVDEMPNSAELRAVKLPEPETHIPESHQDQTELPLEGSASDAPPEEKPKKKPRAKSKKNAEEAPAPAGPEAEAGPEPDSTVWSAPDDGDDTPLTTAVEETAADRPAE